MAIVQRDNANREEYVVLWSVELHDAIVNMYLLCLNDGRINRMVGSQGDEDGITDLALASSAFALNFCWDILGHHDSDHCPCVVLFKRTPP